MLFFSTLYTIAIAPIELLLEVIFTVANRVIGNTGLSIIFLSLAVNFLVLPLYIRADELQNEERNIQKKMAFHIKNIKKTFKGNERFMMLQEYYRINNYKPVYALKSATSLLLQVPFFIAAYNLLSHMQSLQGMSFWCIKDLGKADATFMIGSFAINILPILMTLINIVSGNIYTNGHPIKEKIRIYGLALIFLVLLYNSPAGLVFYWLLNNVFSLLKNIFYKLKEPKKTLSILFAIVGCAVIILTWPRNNLDTRQKILLTAGGILLILPILTLLLKTEKEKKERPKDTGLFFCGALLMAFITGLFIPCTVIHVSAEDFINVLYPSNPIHYVVYTMCIALGTWVLWGGVFYFFMSNRMKSFFSEGIWILCGVSIFDFMTAGTNLGIISPNLQYKIAPVFTVSDYLINALVILAVALAFHFIYTRFRSVAKIILIAGIVAVIPFATINLRSANQIYNNFVARNKIPEEMPSFTLSKDGQNVIVLMLDRAIGPEVPYIFNDKPELTEQFGGFTYFPNTISYGGHTNFAAPALFGGYEYTPARLNNRDSELLPDKHNEALKVMPVIFDENGYDVTIFDPPYAGYTWIPDLSIFDEYSSFSCYNTGSYFNYFEDSISSEDYNDLLTGFRERNFFCFSLMKISPAFFQETIYDGGAYNDESAGSNSAESVTSAADLVQKTNETNTTSSGYDPDFLNSYAALTHLKVMTKVSEGSQNTFLVMANDTPHQNCLLQEPDYKPSNNVDNTAYDTDMVSRYTIDGRTMDMSTKLQITHYHVNMASFLILGEWFDYLREMGVYDNTRIILVSDHGSNVGHFDMTCNDEDLEFYMPLLMFKDFNSTGFTVCEDFMTNADTPVLATSDLISDPTNPFTGNPINSDRKQGKQIIISSECWDVSGNSGTRFLPSYWYAFEGDPYDPECWEYIGIA